MTSIRKFACASLLALTALTFAPGSASAQEPARGKFTLTHEVHWAGATVPAGDYKFSFDPNGTSRTMYLSRTDGDRAGYLLLVPTTEDAKPADQSQLILSVTNDGSYVSAMQLPEFGMTLHFAVPSHPAVRQVAKAATGPTAGTQ
jgi:hypothetical protein